MNFRLTQIEKQYICIHKIWYFLSITQDTCKMCLKRNKQRKSKEIYTPTVGTRNVKTCIRRVILNIILNIIIDTKNEQYEHSAEVHRL